jgi:hypothetical protein
MRKPLILVRGWNSQQTYGAFCSGPTYFADPPITFRVLYVIHSGIGRTAAKLQKPWYWIRKRVV